MYLCYTTSQITTGPKKRKRSTERFQEETQEEPEESQAATNYTQGLDGYMAAFKKDDEFGLGEIIQMMENAIVIKLYEGKLNTKWTPVYCQMGFLY